ncbi:MAG: inositol monophosphatase, partial [Nitrospinae bacterium CG11_big_fil_rev_8_21_14_0_20_56_8]
MTEALKIAVEAALAAGRIQRERQHNMGRVADKSAAAGDLVTEVDLLCEREIIRIIRQRFPDHAILAEETGESRGRESASKWIIDPLDGTLNYAHGFPCYCSSVALECDGEIVVGAIYNPCLDELFTAEKGKGAALNSRPIHVSKIAHLKQSLLVTGFTPQIVNTLDNNLIHFANMMKACQAVRRPGSAALDLCYTAMGRFEGFWEMKLSPWDMAAGFLIAREAGATVTRFGG